MNKNAKKWVQVLRSGRYKQSKYQLKTNEGYCCLGVACDLYAKEKHIVWDGTDFLGNAQTLPHLVMAWMGLSSPTGIFITRPGVQCSLSWCNDRDMSFEEIADVIESNSKRLFKRK